MQLSSRGVWFWDQPWCLFPFHRISGWGGHDPGPALPPSLKPEGGKNGVLVGRGEERSHLEQRGGKSTMWVGLKSSIHLCLNQVQLSSF